MDDVRNLFKKFVSGSQIFKNKDVLDVSYLPSKLLHRDEEIREIVEALAPVLKGRVPPNIFVYGPPGTGKTAAIKLVGSALVKEAKEHEVPVDFVYLNPGVDGSSNTPYKLFSKLSTYFGNPVPHTGLSTSTVISSFYLAVDSEPRIVVLALDEVDKISSLPFVLYVLSRANTMLENSRISLICISNRFDVLSKVDSRTKSSLSPIEIAFKPYNADQIKEILEERAKEAFNIDIDEEVLSLCAAYSVRTHGDLRRALNLLKFAGEIAESEGSSTISVEHVKKAKKRMEEVSYVKIVQSLPLHSRLLLKCALSLESISYTGELYEKYKEQCQKYGIKPLTLRRVNDLLNELAELGLISFSVVSRGRYGRTRVITASIEDDIKSKLYTLLGDDL